MSVRGINPLNPTMQGFSHKQALTPPAQRRTVTTASLPPPVPPPRPPAAAAGSLAPTRASGPRRRTARSGTQTHSWPARAAVRAGAAQAWPCAYSRSSRAVACAHSTRASWEREQPRCVARQGASEQAAGPALPHLQPLPPLADWLQQQVADVGHRDRLPCRNVPCCVHDQVRLCGADLDAAAAAAVAAAAAAAAAKEGEVGGVGGAGMVHQRVDRPARVEGRRAVSA